jgi:hypothetical protein
MAYSTKIKITSILIASFLLQYSMAIQSAFDLDSLQTEDTNARHNITRIQLLFKMSDLNLEGPPDILIYY